jgi:hypothetical protein
MKIIHRGGTKVNVFGLVHVVLVDLLLKLTNMNLMTSLKELKEIQKIFAG